MQKDVEAYLVHSYLYYVLNTSVISDSEYDILCKKLLDSGIEHPLISKGDLAAGTGYSITEYPEGIIKEAKRLAEAALPVEMTPDSAADQFEFKFTGDPMETWLLLGMYIDYGHAKMRDRQDLLRIELQRRWFEGTHKEIFLKYFEDHNVTLERFGLK